MTETPESSADQPADVGESIGNVLFDTWLLSRAVHALIDDAIRPSGLDADEFAIYSTLASGDGLTPTDLAHWMAAPTTTVSSYIKRFERRGHVKRSPNPDDRRSYLLELTDSGRQAHLTAGELFAPTLAEVEQALGSEVTAASDHLQTIRRLASSLLAARRT